MNAFEIAIVLVAVAAGILIAAFTTVYCAVRLSRERHDRQLFNTYVRAPHEVEAWLVHGALTQIRKAVPRGTQGLRLQ
jgi:hypothetical protein